MTYKSTGRPRDPCGWSVKRLKIFAIKGYIISTNVNIVKYAQHITSTNYSIVTRRPNLPPLVVCWATDNFPLFHTLGLKSIFFPSALKKGVYTAEPTHYLHIMSTPPIYPCGHGSDQFMNWIGIDNHFNSIQHELNWNWIEWFWIGIESRTDRNWSIQSIHFRLSSHSTRLNISVWHNYGNCNVTSNPAMINTSRPRQNGRHIPHDIFKCIFLNENIWILIKISLKFVPKGPINNIPSLVHIMAWRRPGDKPLFEPMMVWLLTHICVTRPQWVKKAYPHAPLDVPSMGSAGVFGHESLIITSNTFRYFQSFNSLSLGDLQRLSTH